MRNVPTAAWWSHGENIKEADYEVTVLHDLFVPSIERGQSRRKIDVVGAGKERMQNYSMSRTFRFLRAKQFSKWMLAMMYTQWYG